jgi:hypothetical protein
MSLVQKLAVAYALLFFGVVAIGYVPAFNDATNGYLFGVFAAFVGFWLSKRMAFATATA